jgi:hypothetical protein
MCFTTEGASDALCSICTSIADLVFVLSLGPLFIPKASNEETALILQSVLTTQTLHHQIGILLAMLPIMGKLTSVISTSAMISEQFVVVCWLEPRRD